MKGKFITFEGCDGSGKTTQVSMLCEALDRCGIKVHRTKEPGGSALAQDIRTLLLNTEIEDPITEMLLISAARREHIKIIKSMLSDGIWVVSDRYIDSSLAYQGYAKGGELDTLKGIMRVAHEDLYPEVTFVLDIDPKEAQNRMSASNQHNTFYDTKSLNFHNKIRHAFLSLSAAEKDRIYTIDGDKDGVEIHNEIMMIVRNKFNDDNLFMNYAKR